jgi:hypothetical protein
MLIHYCQKTLKKYFKHGLKWQFMYVFGRYQFIRWLAHMSQPAAPIYSYDEAQSVFADLNVTHALQLIQRDGIFLGARIPSPLVAEIVEFATNNICYGDGHLDRGFHYGQRQSYQAAVGQTFALGRFFNTAALVPAIAQIAADPKLQKIAAQYLGTTPLNTENRLWWSFADDIEDSDRYRFGQTFHYDIDDYGCLRFFFYLTDVDGSAGPHIAIRGSHRKKKFSYVLPFSKRRAEADLLRYYGKDAVTTICGPAGFGFAEDPFCFHKGQAPHRRDRLILQIQYTMTDFGAAGDDAPILLPLDELARQPVMTARM